MNDCIEFVTWPTHQNLFYRIRTKALVFNIKGQKNAAIGLSAKPGRDCRYWVKLNMFLSTYPLLWPTIMALVCGGKMCINGEADCQILKHDKQVCTTPTQNILSVREYQRFWISWYGNVLKFGRNENAEAILSRRIKKMNLKYVTFAVVDETNELYWKFHIPSPIKNIPLAKFNEGKAYWVKVDNQLQDNVVIGGFENEPLYIVRSTHHSSLTPGKFVPSEGIGYVSWGGASHPKPGKDLEVLCGYNMIWKQTKENKIPIGSVKGGYSEVNHEILYIGRAYHNGHVIPGKVQPTHNVCYFSYEDKEEAENNYEILVFPHPCSSSSDHYVTVYGYTYLEGESSTSTSNS